MKKIKYAAIGLALPLLSIPLHAQDSQDTQPKAFDFGKMMGGVMAAAKQNLYSDALTYALEGLSYTQGIQKLSVLHLSIDLHRILNQWEKVPPLVDDFQELYSKTKIPPGRDTWATNIMSEKAAAAVHIGDVEMAVKASKEALALYGNLSQTWATNAEGAWVSSKTNQVCPIIWRDHIRFDAYDKENGSTSCRFWDSNMYDGVSLTLYKGDMSDPARILDKQLSDFDAEVKAKNQGEVTEVATVDPAFIALLPAHTAYKAYRWSWGNFPSNGIYIINAEKGWMLDINYNDQSVAWAKKSLKKIQNDLH